MHVVYLFYFPLQSISLSISTFITEGSIHNTKVWYTILFLALDQIT